MRSVAYVLRIGAVCVSAASLGGCASMFGGWRETDERQCLARAMYFESNRSSDDGMMAVGTVVMNRRESGRYPRTICGVVGQPRQFAPGALSSPMGGRGKARALRNADRILAGERRPGLEGVMFFHTAGYEYPYSNMQYRLVAGGNAFYEKRYARPGEPQQTQLAAIERQYAAAPPLPPQRVLSRQAPSVEPASQTAFPVESSPLPIEPTNGGVTEGEPLIAPLAPDEPDITALY
jgi:spore germination cell wall hydrolase CwlJ-like protein